MRKGEEEELVACGYIRVSSDEQVRHGISLDTQKHRIRSYCQAQGLELYHIYADEGLSGARQDRPALAELLGNLQRNNIKAVVVWKFDRIARNARHLLEIVETLQNSNIRFVSVTESFDTGSHIGKFQITVLAACAEFERALIVERLKDNLSHKISLGNWHGPAPLGYCHKNRSIAEDKRTSKYVKEVFRRYLAGASLRDLGKYLAEVLPERVPPKGLHIIHVKRILTCYAYIGMIPNAGRAKKGQRRQPKPVPGNFPAIIDQNDFEQVQKLLERRSKRGRDRNSRFLLTGLLFCPKCGAKMWGHSHRTTYQRRDGISNYNFVRYYCSGKTDVRKLCSYSLSQRKIERQLFKWIEILSVGHAPLELVEFQTPDTDRKGMLLNQLQKLQARAQRQWLAYEHGTITEEKYLEINQPLQVEIARAQKEYDCYKPTAPSKTQARKVFANLVSVLKDESLPFEFRKRALETVVEYITVDSDGGLKVRFRLP
jgi:site-specific DNA recombinase